MAEKLVIVPEELRKAAGNFTEAIEAVEGALRNAEGLVKGSGQYWEGIAWGIHQEAWGQIEERFHAVLEKLKEHPAELLETAGETDEVVEGTVRRATALPTNIIN